ncbi:M20/M25/M40 family metallo-hydrolase [Actinocrispum wychmicini]|uniref:Acetylornithine deacetylase n=1 Tax=Actinocrispum wychmicini TaxID=1213861 RepID=A0A4R2JC73_9PSEU|nr:M20/M25/M40 family metallo-hydrolase [Actinocrispum wychmicini]TCO55592.1 acetylornithine deacetylase [Actinocrispum wychmicini]
MTRGPVDETTAVGLLRGALEIPSPSYHEAELAAYLVDVVRKLGMAAHIDRVGNLVASVENGDGPTVMLISHLDTVPGDLPVFSRDGRLYGRGAVDAKGSLAAMICAALGTSRFRGRIVVVGAVEEETPKSRGAMEIRATHARPDAVIVGEPSGWSSVVLGYKGKLDLSYRVTCPPTHPSNPVEKASESAVAAWTALLDELGPDAGHGAFDRPGATLCSITGDTTVAEAEFSIRTPVGFSTDAFLARLGDRVTKGELAVVNAVAACRSGRSDPVVRALTAAIRAQDGEPTMKVKTATSDMNTLAEVWDVPMAAYGPGDSTLDHADDEHIVIAEYLHGIAVLSAALEDIATAWRPSRPARHIRVLPMKELT